MKGGIYATDRCPICGDGYIDIWNMNYTTYDGTHPDEQTSRAIIDMVKEAMSKL